MNTHAGHTSLDGLILPRFDPKRLRILIAFLSALLVTTAIAPALVRPLPRAQTHGQAAAVATPADFVLPADEDPPWPDDIKIADSGTLAFDSLPLEAQFRANAAVGEADERFHVKRGAGMLFAHNPDSQFTTEFTRMGPTLRAGVQRLAITVAGVGYGNTVSSDPAENRAEVKPNAVAYIHDGFTERYDNGPLGLAQSFEIAAPPKTGDRNSGLIAVMRVNGSLTAKVNQNERSASFATSTGKTVFQYSKLKAIDAAGRSLPVRLETAQLGAMRLIGRPTGQSLVIRIDDSAAHYPVTIDPRWTHLDERESGSTFDGFGYSVATLTYHPTLTNYELRQGIGLCGLNHIQMVAIGAPRATISSETNAGSVAFVVNTETTNWYHAAATSISQDMYWGGHSVQADAAFGKAVDLTYGEQACEPLLVAGAPTYQVYNEEDFFVRSGAAFLYRLTVSAPPKQTAEETFELYARLTANHNESLLADNEAIEPMLNGDGDNFGFSVAVSVGVKVDDNNNNNSFILLPTVLVGAPKVTIKTRGNGTKITPQWTTQNAGRAYVFIKNSRWSGFLVPPDESDNSWDVIPRVSLMPGSGPTAYQRDLNFGWAVSMENHGQYSTMAVGAPGKPKIGMFGYVYLWNMPTAIGGWTNDQYGFPKRQGPTQRIQAEDQGKCEESEADDAFGTSVDIRSNPLSIRQSDDKEKIFEIPAKLVVGSPGDTLYCKGRIRGGSARVFAHLRPAEGKTPRWKQTNILIQDEFGGRDGGQFGNSVSINADGTRIYVGAPHGHVGEDKNGMGAFFTFSSAQSTAEDFKPKNKPPIVYITGEGVKAPYGRKYFARQLSVSSYFDFAAVSALKDSSETIFGSRYVEVYDSNPIALRDVGFDSDGMASLDLGGSDVVDAVGYAPDGRIVVAGKSGNDFAVARYNPDGSMDTTFDGDGKVVTDWGGGSVDEFTDVTVLGDGRILAVGKITANDFAVVRYNADGSLDTTFDGDGKVATNFGSTDSASALGLLGDDGFVVAGTSNNNFALAAYHEDGSLDTSFDTDGLVTTDFGSTEVGSAVSVWTESSGEGDEETLTTKIVVAGTSNNNFAVAQYAITGALDTSFDSDGKATTDFGGVEAANAVTVTEDGKLVVAGASGGNVALAQYLPNGALDPGFDVDGKLSTDFGGTDGAFEVAVQDDGKIVVAGGGGSGSDVVLARYWGSNGAPDASFSGDGKQVTSFGGTDAAYAMAIHQYGEIVVAGVTDGNFAVGRFTQDGSLDTGFDLDGKVSTNIGASDYIYGVVTQPDGKIVVAGYTLSGSAGDFVVARYWPWGALDTSFSGDGIATTSIGTTDSAMAVALQPDGKIVLAGASGSGDFALVRYNSDGSLDTGFDTDGVVTTNMGGNDSANAVAIQADGKIVAAGGNGADFAVARYNGDGSLDVTFSGDGKATVDLFGVDEVKDLLIQPDDKIVLAGNANLSDFAVARLYSTGGLDASFSGDGKQTTSIGATAGIFGITQQNDGRLVAAGHSDGNFALLRYYPDGSLDPDFDGDGKLTTDFGSAVDAANDVAISPAGRLIAVGRGGAGNDVALACYQADGSLDTEDCEESGTGKMTVDFGGFDYARQMAFLADNTMVLGGSGGAGTDFALIRFDSKEGGAPPVVAAHTPPPTGRPDVGFDLDGKASTDLGGTDLVYGSARQRDGKVVLAGSTGGDFALARYNPDGSLDSGFDTDGKVIADLGGIDVAHAVIVLGDDTILAAGSTGGDFTLAAFNPDGSPDTGFGTNGVLTTDLGGSDTAWALADRDDGRIVVVGETGANFAIAAYNRDGSLDSEFSGDGKLIQDMGGSDIANALSIGADDKLVVAGTDLASFAVARFNPDGTLDTSFDGDGKAYTDFGGTDIAQSVAVQTDGRIVVAGNGGAGADFALARYLPTGALDPDFSGDGKQTTNMGGTDMGRVLGVQPDGKILLGGGSGASFLLARYRIDGELDTSFDTDGKLATDLGGANGAGLSLGEDGRITLAGTGGTAGGAGDFAVVRYLPSGALDVGFDGDAKVLTNINGTDTGNSIALQPDGKILVAAVTGNNNFTIARYNPNGSLDTSFDGDGLTNTDLGGVDVAYVVLVQPDGKIVAGGVKGADLALVRYTTTGALDTSFDGDGKLTRLWGNGVVLYAGAIQPDGKLVFAGSTLSGANNDFALIRYNTNGSADTSFDADGLVKTDFGANTDAAYRLTLQPDGKIVLAGESNANLALARYNTNGSLDTSFDGDGITTTDLGTAGDQATAVALRPDGQIMIGANTNSDFALARYNTNGSLDTSFDGDGKLTTDLGGTDKVAAINLSPDGGIILAGRGGSGSDFAVTVYDSGGALDTTFDTDGKYLTSMSAGTDIIYGTAIQPDGALIAAGAAGTDIGLLRLY